MFDINGNQYKVTYSAKSSNGNDFRILNNENLIIKIEDFYGNNFKESFIKQNIFKRILKVF